MVGGLATGYASTSLEASKIARLVISVMNLLLCAKCQEWYILVINSILVCS
jgi:hypothetical protein